MERHQLRVEPLRPNPSSSPEQALGGVITLSPRRGYRDELSRRLVRRATIREFTGRDWERDNAPTLGRNLFRAISHRG